MQELINQLQYDLEKHGNTAMKIRRELNSLAYVNRLPTELMSMIFHHYTTHETWVHPAAWIIIAHICQRWRQIVLNTPYLWTTINLPVHPEYLEAALIEVLPKGITRCHYILVQLSKRSAAC